MVVETKETRETTNKSSPRCGRPCFLAGAVLFADNTDKLRVSDRVQSRGLSGSDSQSVNEPTVAVI